MKPLVTDELWGLVEPLLPRRRAHAKGGRPWVDDRAVLTGILFVLRSGIPWRMLPPEMGCGSGVTCWRRLREWQRRGVWKRLHRVMLDRLAAADQIDWTRAALDSRSLPAKKGSSGITGKRCADFEEEVGVVAVAVGHALQDLDLVVHALQHARVQRPAAVGEDAGQVGFEPLREAHQRCQPALDGALVPPVPETARWYHPSQKRRAAQGAR